MFVVVHDCMNPFLHVSKSLMLLQWLEGVNGKPIWKIPFVYVTHVLFCFASLFRNGLEKVVGQKLVLFASWSQHRS